MSYYVRRGDVPHKRHTQFRQPDGSLYHEEVMGIHGFAGIQSLLYHLRPPTGIERLLDAGPDEVRYEPPGALRHQLLRTAGLSPSGDASGGRVPLMANADLRVSVVRPVEPMTYWYRYAHGDELIFVHEGEGGSSRASSACWSTTPTTTSSFPPASSRDLREQLVGGGVARKARKEEHHDRQGFRDVQGHRRARVHAPSGGGGQRLHRLVCPWPHAPRPPPALHRPVLGLLQPVPARRPQSRDQRRHPRGGAREQGDPDERARRDLQHR